MILYAAFAKTATTVSGRVSSRQHALEVPKTAARSRTEITRSKRLTCMRVPMNSIIQQEVTFAILQADRRHTPTALQREYSGRIRGAMGASFHVHASNRTTPISIFACRVLSETDQQSHAVADPDRDKRHQWTPRSDLDTCWNLRTLPEAYAPSVSVLACGLDLALPARSFRWSSLTQ